MITIRLRFDQPEEENDNALSYIIMSVSVLSLLLGLIGLLYILFVL
jgi:hypothetical protein